jgi:hypothetical protein
MNEKQPSTSIFENPLIADYLRFSHRAIYESGLMSAYNKNLRNSINLRAQENYVPAIADDEIVLNGLKMSLGSELPIIPHVDKSNYGGEINYYLGKVDPSGDILRYSLVGVSTYDNYTGTKLDQNVDVSDVNELLVRELLDMQKSIGWYPVLASNPVVQ